MEKGVKSFLKGAAIISLGGFISKALGAIYRIPLTNVLGGEGMGIYQMVYPLYCILLTVSASGIPTGIARLISSGKGGGAEKKAFILYGAVGLLGSALLYIFAEPLAILQGEPAVALCCKMLSPSVFLVSIISVIRGYFQGKGNMYPTAVSEISEQLVKLISGCALAYAFRKSLAHAVAATLFAVTVSEFVAACITVIWYYKRREITLKTDATYPDILKFTLPLTLTAMALPLSQLVESVAVVRLLKAMGEDAVKLYGIYSGCAVTIINLPVSITYGLAASSVPEISPLAETGDISGAKSKAYGAIAITLALSSVMAVGLYMFAPLVTGLIFSSLGQAEAELLIRLVRIMAVSSVTLSAVQTSSACLTALGKPSRSASTQWLTAIMRVALAVALIKFTPLSIEGAAWAANIAYLVATFLNFCYIIRIKQTEGDVRNENYADRARGAQRRPHAES